MTLVQGSAGFHLYVNPGTDDDGFVAAEWRVDDENGWSGGAGEWNYVAIVPHEGEPEHVYAFRPINEHDRMVFRGRENLRSRKN